ncbi:hypothetical protein J437_LFUL014615 [Ladona fulva]|uniref:SOCS box domain-containing protein n=1 Tax=Ladona fulva TaxID=123851 RepID=A0A8K0P614_LADFU|nr:hypothetical protein J437_LFUL014615 [Ladona fulva]
MKTFSSHEDERIPGFREVFVSHLQRHLFTLGFWEEPGILRETAKGIECDIPRIVACHCSDLVSGFGERIVPVWHLELHTTWSFTLKCPKQHLQLSPRCRCGTGAEGGSSDRAVCSGEEGAVATTSDRDQSAFTWFLRAVIRRRRVEHCSETLALLSQVMGECPRRMHSHVLRTMFRHVKCYKILGPVFYQLKLSMMRYWTQPHDLRYLCWRTLRKSLRPGGHLVSGAAKLGLPKPVQQYLLMET